MNDLIEEALKEFDEVGFGNQARIVGVKRRELKDFLRSKLEKAYRRGKKDGQDQYLRRVTKLINETKA